MAVKFGPPFPCAGAKEGRSDPLLIAMCRFPLCSQSPVLRKSASSLFVSEADIRYASTTHFHSFFAQLFDQAMPLELKHFDRIEV